MKNFKIIVFAVIALFFMRSAAAQDIDTLFHLTPMDYRTFMGRVGQENIAYAAEKFNIDIAEAEVETARIFPDPELGFGWFDNGESRIMMGYGFVSELSWRLELGGKRKARIDLAKNQAQLTRLVLEDYFRNLRADATLAYLLTMQNRMLWSVQYSSYQQLQQLAASDSIRFQLGAISQVDARQSKLEAGTLLNEVYNAEANYKTSGVALSLLMGQAREESPIDPQGDFSKFDRDFNLQNLVATALHNRTDLRAALQQKDVSASILKLAKANRVIDLDLTFGVSHATEARNYIAPTPAFTTVQAGVAIPLKFSNNRPGELHAAQYTAAQAEYVFRQVELEIQTEITQAFYLYQSIKKQVLQFDQGLLTEAKAILDGKIYSYQRGETSLLEVLNAQRTYNEVQLGYYQTLYQYAEALVELERASGMWDIDF